MRKRIKYSLIENKTSRKTTFHKRKRGIVKKLTELVALCDVKACGVIYGPYNPEPEAWPSREGVEELVTDFMKVSVNGRTKNMVDQEAYLRKMIAKTEAQLQKVCDDNRNIQVQEMMWGCLRGEIDVNKLGKTDLHDLNLCIDKYRNQVTCRMKNIRENGESSSSLPSRVAADALAISIPQENHDLNMNQNVSFDLNQDLNVEEEGDSPSMNGSHHQTETDSLATTGDDACAPNITNNLES